MPPALETISANLSSLRERMNSAAERAGRDSRSIALMAVTKTRAIAEVEAAYRAGCRLFGENRVREAEEKFPGFLAAHPDARLEMIGHLQSNKAKKAVAMFSRVQSVDSESLLVELDKRAGAVAASGAAARFEVLLELRTGEDSKSGFAGIDELLSACEIAASLPSISVRGLMTMAPLTDEAAAIRASFRSLRRARETIAARFAFEGSEVLSMGMSDDFEVAIEEGSTMIRIGTGLFGPRAK